jgi:hypothetical protein
MDRETLCCWGSTNPAKQARRGHTVVQASLVGLATLACLGSVVAFVKLHPCEAVIRQPDRDGPAISSKELFKKLNLFDKWGRPDLVLMLSGEMHGYLQPCGCTNPQYGGLTRRYNLWQALQEQGWPVVALDLGDMPQRSGPQAMLKYTYGMRALDVMKYSAVSVGEIEMRWHLPNIIGEYALNNPTPRILAGNIVQDQNFKDFISDSELAAGQKGVPKVGVVSLIGPSVEKQVTAAGLPLPKFKPGVPQILTAALVGLQKKGADINVMLYQGTDKEAEKVATFCQGQRQKNAAFPQLDVILCLSDNPEPPGQPAKVGNTLIVMVGHKGRFVGVMGVFRNNADNPPFKLEYQLVSIAPEFETRANKVEGHKLMELMKKYAEEVKTGNYLAKFKQTEHPIQLVFKNAQYVGSDDCKTCHKDAFKIWKGSGHAHAYKTLEDAKNPSLRQFDGECVVCHTVGFNYKTGFRDLQKTAFLTDVGCECCHGPCSDHVANPRNADIHKEINPFKYRGKEPEAAPQNQARMQRIDNFCQKCHDLDNDVNWVFANSWPKIVHMNK